MEATVGLSDPKKLYLLHGSPTSATVFMAVQHLGLDYETEWFQLEDLFTERLTKVSPQCILPVLVTPEGPLYEATSILKFLVKQENRLYGTSAYQNAQVDQWLSWADNELSFVARCLLILLAGFPFPGKPTDFNELKQTLLTKLDFLNTKLEGKHYLVGDQLTVADFHVINYVYPFLTFIITESERKAIPSVVSYIEYFSGSDEFRKVHGRLRLCKEPFKLPKLDKPATQKAPQEKKEQKAAAPKEKKPEPDTDEIAEPKVKEPEFPPTQLNLMTFKTYFVNEKDMEKAMAEFWNQFKEGEWSLYHLKYIKYPGECEVIYRTNNLVRGFLSNIENIRKYLFGTHMVLGDEPNLSIEGVWLVRGSGLFDQLKDVQSFDTYDWIKLDSTKETDRAIVADFWTHRKEDEEQVQGKTIRTFKWIK